MPSKELISLLGGSLLKGKHLIVGSEDADPFIFCSNTSTNGQIDDVSGFVYQIVLYLSVKYQFTLEFVRSRDKAFGAFSNGSWNGLVGMLLKGDIDLLATGLAITYQRCTVADCTVHFTNELKSLLIPYPEIEIGLNGIAKPFQFEVWIFMGVSCGVVSVVLWKILSLLHSISNESKESGSLIGSFWSLIDHFHDIANNKTSQTAIRLLLAAWCLACFVLFQAYSSTLISYLMAPRYHPMIDSMEDIANTTPNQPVLTVLKNSAQESEIMIYFYKTSEIVAARKIGDVLRKHPELRVSNTDEAVELVANHHKVYFSNRANLLALMEQDLKASGQCRLYLAEKSWGTIRHGMALPKNSPITQIFNREINWLRQVGLLDYWHKRFWPHQNRCNVPPADVNKGQLTKLTFMNLSSAFMLLGGGLLLSFFVFFIEIIFARYQKK